MSKTTRINEALQIARNYGGIDGAHHKAWVIDQMVRALTGCLMVDDEATDCRGEKYSYSRRGESKRYKRFVTDARAGEDGPQTYDWDEGTPP